MFDFYTFDLEKLFSPEGVVKAVLNRGVRDEKNNRSFFVRVEKSP